MQDVGGSAVCTHKSYRRRHTAIAIVVLAMLSLGCSAADLVVRQRSTPVAVQDVTLVPTFTPTPVALQTIVIVTPPSDGLPGVIIIPPGMDPNVILPIPPTPLPELTPTPPSVPPTSDPGDTATGVIPADSTNTPIPSATPTATQIAPTSTSTPVPSATPYIMVSSGLVSLRTGPGIDYPQVTQLGPNIPIAITGASSDGAWLQICCISGESMWVPTQHIIVYNDISQLTQALFQPPPPATATSTPTVTTTPSPTPTATPYPFELAIGPQFFPTNNEHLTIWTKLFIGTPPSEVAAPGYYLTALFEGFERPNSAGNESSGDNFEFSAPPGSGSRVPYNFKYEYVPPDPLSLDPAGNLTTLGLLGTGTWTVYVSDGGGNQLSEPVTFTTAPENPNREIYLGWARVR